MAERKRKPLPTVNGKQSPPEKWTWQMAEEALAKNVINRHLRQNDVDKYARTMSDKLWGAKDARPEYRASPGMLIFDWDGNLIDGQHRLHAQVQSRTTQRWYVLRGVPPGTQHHIDTGLARTASDLLRFAGFSNYIVLSSVARWAWMLEQGMLHTGKVKVSNDEILDMVERHPDLEHSSAIGQYVRGGFVDLYPTPVGAAHWWIAQHNDHQEADMFMDRIRDIRREPDGSAIYAMLKRFQTARANNTLIQTRVQIAMMIRAWNLDVQRVYVHRFPIKSRHGEYKLPEVLKRTETQDVSFGPLESAGDFDSDYDPEDEKPNMSVEEPAEAESA